MSNAAENSIDNILEEFFENFTSENTRVSYRQDLNQFHQWVLENFKIDSWKEVDRIHVIKFRNYLSEAGGIHGAPCAPKTISRKLAGISSFFHFLVEKRILQANPATSVKRPRAEVRGPTQALSASQVIALLAAIDENKRSGPLHSALLTTFFTTGLRKSEILFLKRKDLVVKNKNWLIRYQGKGGKLGEKLVHPLCREKLENYFLWMKDQDRVHGPEDWLFQPSVNPSDPTNLNRPLNPKTINEIIDRYAKSIGLDFKVTPHSARATFISELLEVGVDIYTIAKEVNHSSVTTTQEYDKRRKKIKNSPIGKLPF